MPVIRVLGGADMMIVIDDANSERERSNEDFEVLNKNESSIKSRPGCGETILAFRDLFMDCSILRGEDMASMMPIVREIESTWTISDDELGVTPEE